jgi:hypothetical protein
MLASIGITDHPTLLHSHKIWIGMKRRLDTLAHFFRARRYLFKRDGSVEHNRSVDSLYGCSVF